MTKPVCVPCARFYRPRHNGFPFIEGMPDSPEPADQIPRGSKAGDHWKPYKLWLGDMWRCDGCGHEIVVGVAHIPISEHYHPHFEELCEKAKSDYGRGRKTLLQVNDC